MDILSKRFLNKLVFPGDKICMETDLKSHENQKLIVGPGLFRDCENLSIVANRVGYLCLKAPNKIWLSYYQSKVFKFISKLILSSIYQMLEIV